MKEEVINALKIFFRMIHSRWFLPESWFKIPLGDSQIYIP